MSSEMPALVGQRLGDYTITALGVCYPNTNFGCYQATVKGDQLEWFQDGKSQGTGTIVKGNPLNF